MTTRDPEPITTPLRRWASIKRLSLICLAAFIGTLAVTYTQLQPNLLHRQTESGTTADAHAQAVTLPVNVTLFLSVPSEQQEEFRAKFERQFSGFAEQHGLLDVGVFGKPELTIWLWIIRPDSEYVDPSEHFYLIFAIAHYRGKMRADFYRTCLQCLPEEVVAASLSDPLTKAMAIAKQPSNVDVEPRAVAAKNVRLVVDASALGDDDASYFETEIGTQIAEGLAADGFEVTERGDSTVRLEIDYFDEHDRDFLILTDVAREGQMAVTNKPSTCPACVDDELVEAAVAVLPEVLELLRADPQQFP